MPASQTLYIGDCRTALADLPTDSIDAIVTDPPYELTANKRGGSGVASVNPNSPAGRARIGTGNGAGGFMGKAWDATGVAFDTDMWAECLRVLKPGGHLLAFGGSRTWHRMATAIEDAGFEIRDSIHWTYGCLTDDAEILTAHGWRRGVDVVKGDDVAQWDSFTGDISFGQVQETFAAPWDGPMVRLANEFTDQILTPNHRVYHAAATDDGWTVSEAGDLDRTVPLLLPMSGAAASTTPLDDGALGDLFVELAVPTPASSPMPWWGWVALGQMTCAQAEDLVRLVLSVAGVLHPNGTVTVTFPNPDLAGYFQAVLTLAGQHGSAQTEAGTPITNVASGDHATPVRVVVRTDGAVSELAPVGDGEQTVDYTGDVWCVRVPTGAFVARRNGQVFITGNSGFPKSMDISRAIDKKLGAERARTPAAKSGGMASLNKANADHGYRDKAYNEDGNTVVSGEPVTEEARQWVGWGTALKPSHEPIVLARKPFTGTLVENVVEFGTGGIHVDAARVAYANAADEAESKGKNRHGDFGTAHGGNTVYGDYSMLGQRINYDPTGRFPTNTLLTHDASCTRLLDAWQCVLGCPVDALDAATAADLPPVGGVGVSRFFHDSDWNPADDGLGHTLYFRKASKSERPVVDGISHPTVKPLALMRYLVRLITPPGGTVLDPFAGSGTTLEAALQEGFSSVGVDLEEDHAKLVNARMRRNHANVHLIPVRDDTATAAVAAA